MDATIIRLLVTLGALALVALQLCAAAILRPLRQVRARRDRRRLHTANAVLRAVTRLNEHNL